jgi:hypothetical protein
MSYSPTSWIEKVTKLGPTNMNKLELGVQATAVVADAASALATAALPTPAGSNGQFLQRVGGLWVPHTLALADLPANIPASGLAGYPADATKLLHGDGSWSAPAAASTVIRGTVTAAGAVGLGTGFSVAHTGTGIYTVTFTVAFGATPIVVAMINGTPFLAFIATNGVTTGSVVIQTWNAASAATDIPFAFIAYQA